MKKYYIFDKQTKFFQAQDGKFSQRLLGKDVKSFETLEQAQAAMTAQALDPDRFSAYGLHTPK